MDSLHKFVCIALEFGISNADGRICILRTRAPIVFAWCFGVRFESKSPRSRTSKDDNWPKKQKEESCKENMKIVLFKLAAASIAILCMQWPYVLQLLGPWPSPIRPLPIIQRQRSQKLSKNTVIHSIKIKINALVILNDIYSNSRPAKDKKKKATE